MSKHRWGAATRTKYAAKRTEVDGITFDSKKEARRYCELKLLLESGAIGGLELQREFPLVVNGTLVTRYVADFVYLENGATVVEDAKGYRTREYLLKKKLLYALHGIEIKET